MYELKNLLATYFHTFTIIDLLCCSCVLNQNFKSPKMKKTDILAKAIKRLEDDYKIYVKQLEKDVEALNAIPRDEYDIKNRKAIIKETENAIVVTTKEIARFKKDLKDLEYVKKMDDERFEC